MLSVGKPEEKTALGRPRRKWADNNKMGVREIIWGGIDWVEARGRLVS
jgi:hypothetical protein